MVGVGVLTLVERPAVAGRSHRVLDLALLASLAAVAMQLVPLHPSIRLTLSPAAGAIDRALRLAEPANPLAAPPRPLSIDPEATAWALVTGISLVLLFWCARAMLARSGVRVVVRGVAALGLALSVLAIVQHATAPTLIYGYWRPARPDLRPYGPFTNRNHFATWLSMAVPLTIGYAIARVRARHRPDEGPFQLESTIDTTELWLGASTVLMTAALVVSLSRSGLIALAIALMVFVWLARCRMRRARVTWLVVGLVTLVALAMAYANMGALLNRVGESLSSGGGGRRVIWRDTWVMIREFWPAGVGVGAYERGMVVYQQSSRLFYYSHADNEYLQLVAEGGLPLVLPMAVALLATLWQIVERLYEDRSALFWIRAGATCGLVAVAVQSVWENGLRLPANAVLFAILAAIAVHQHSNTR
jgi:O-antigen ligase